MKYSEVKYIVKEMKRLAVEDALRKQLSLLDVVKADNNSTRHLIKFWWKSSTLRTSIKRVLKGMRDETCIHCALWSDFDSCCWCPESPRYLDEVDGYTPTCEEFKPKEQEDENEDDA